MKHQHKFKGSQKITWVLAVVPESNRTSLRLARTHRAGCFRVSCQIKHPRRVHPHPRDLAECLLTCLIPYWKLFTAAKVQRAPVSLVTDLAAPLLFPLVLKQLTAPPLTCSSVTSSWLQVTASLTTCRTTWFFRSLKNSRWQFIYAFTNALSSHFIENVCGMMASYSFNAFYFYTFQTTNYDSILQTAQSIAKQAHDLAYDPNYMSPFAQFACDNGLNVRGKYTLLQMLSFPVLETPFISGKHPLLAALCGKIWLCLHGFSHSVFLFFFFFFFSCRREARWYHGAAVYCGWIYRLKVCATVCVCASLGLVLPSRLPESSTCSPPKKCTASRGLTGEAHQHDAHSSLRGWRPPVYMFLFFFLLFCFGAWTVEW